MNSMDLNEMEAVAAPEAIGGADLLRPLIDAKSARQASVASSGVVIGELIALKDDGRTPLLRYPGGDKVYEALVRIHTTTTLTPRQIHDIGLAQMATVHVYAKLRNYPTYPRDTWRQLVCAIWIAIPALLTPGISPAQPATDISVAGGANTQRIVAIPRQGRNAAG